jgi:serine/threonine protein kinase
VNIEQIKVHMIRDYKTERQLLSVSKLQELWKLPSTSWPKTISLYHLEHYSQIHDTISLVRIPTLHSDKLFVFKSAVDDVKFLYHELKLLLTMPPHSNIMPRPLFLVINKDRYSTENKVYGFVMEYRSQGNLADMLAERAEKGTLELKDQFNWARQITSTMIFIKESPARFYSELKPDNLVLSDGAERVILIDFEQMGNWITFSAPEVHYLEYLLKLSKSDAIPHGERRRYAEMVKEHMPQEQDPHPIYANPPNGYYRPWICFTPAEQEAAEVFSLGKTLWCIFEGCSDTRNSVLKAFKRDSGLEFPDFRRTPAKVRTLIAACTRGNRDGEPDRVEIVRQGSKVYPRGRSGVNGEPLGTIAEARKAAKLMWQQRIQEMEHFLQAKKRWRDGQGREEDRDLVGYPSRPLLSEVLRILTEVEAELVRGGPRMQI